MQEKKKHGIILLLTSSVLVMHASDLDSHFLHLSIRELIKHLIARARAYYAESDAGIPMLAPGSRMAVQAAGDMYSKILDKVVLCARDDSRATCFDPSS